MVYFFSFLTSAAIGFVVFRLSLLAGNRMEVYEQNLQIKILTGLSKQKVPLRFYVERIEKFLKAQARAKILRPYFEFLAGWIRRCAQTTVTPEQIAAYQVIFFLGAFFLFWFLINSLLIALGTAFLAAALPVSLLRDKALRRESKILRELPNALEILSLCVEAGLSLEQGLSQYLENGKPQPLGEEFTQVLEQAKMGSSRKEALRAMALRLNLTDVSLFVTSIIHAEKFGTGIAKTLRQLSATVRDKQAQRIEKAVNELPVKMLLPLLLFIMPVTFLIIFGPVLLSFFN
jgi:tight adherence protein C